VVVKKARGIPLDMEGSTQYANKVKRGDVRRAVICRTKYPTRRADGRYVRFDDNACVLVNSKKEMIGNRIGSVVGAEVRQKGWGKIVAMAPKVI
jgi:ribosomal protein L14